MDSGEKETIKGESPFVGGVLHGPRLPADRRSWPTSVFPRFPYFAKPRHLREWRTPTEELEDPAIKTLESIKIQRTL